MEITGFNAGVTATHWEDDKAAPFIVADTVVAATVIEGMFHITLGAKKFIRDEKGVAIMKARTTAHLRLNPHMAQILMTALRHCSEMAASQSEVEQKASTRRRPN